MRSFLAHTQLVLPICTYVYYIDLKNTYDSIDLELLLSVLKLWEYPPKCLRSPDNLNTA